MANTVQIKRAGALNAPRPGSGSLPGEKKGISTPPLQSRVSPKRNKVQDTQRESRRFTDAMPEMKETLAKKMESLNDRAQRLNAHQANFMQMVQKMGKYVSEAKQRESRAEAVRKQERAKINAQDTIIREKRWKMGQLRVIMLHKSELIKRYQRLHDFVHKIIGAGNLFPNMESVVRRHRTLVLTQRDLTMTRRAALKELNRLRQEYSSIRQHSDIAQAQFQLRFDQEYARLQDARYEAMEAEEDLTSLMDTASQFSLVLFHIGVAVRNLFQRLQSFHPPTLSDDNDIDGQLAFIKDFVLQYSAEGAMDAIRNRPTPPPNERRKSTKQVHIVLPDGTELDPTGQ